MVTRPVKSEGIWSTDVRRMYILSPRPTDVEWQVQIRSVLLFFFCCRNCAVLKEQFTPLRLCLIQNSPAVRGMRPFPFRSCCVVLAFL